MKFRRGDIVFIQPQDDRDPLANEWAGRKVTVQRYSASFGGHVIVDDGGVVHHFREHDLSFTRDLPAGHSPANPRAANPPEPSTTPAEPGAFLHTRSVTAGRDFSGKAVRG
jgi:hypothetical protein